MSIVHVAFVFLALLLLANCSNLATTPATYPVVQGDNRAAQGDNPAKGSHHFSRADVDYDGTVGIAAPRDIRTVDIGRHLGGSSPQETRSASLIPSKRSYIDIDQPVSDALVPVAHSSLGPRPVQDSRFLEKLAKDDDENLLLKRRTVICRGC